MELRSVKLHILLLFYLIGNTLSAQLLEPRAFTNIPKGMNFILGGYNYASGNVLFDPALPIENAQAKVNIFAGTYVRSINFFGLSSKIDVGGAYGIGNWTGQFAEQDTTVDRNGFNDLRFRISVNLFGAPSLKASEFSTYTPKLVSGISLQVIAPTGTYNPDDIVNVGSNRWVLRPQIGLSRNFTHWIFEAYFSTWIFFPNYNFKGGNTITQDLLYSFKIHGIRKFKNKSWLTLDVGYAIGGQAYSNDIKTVFKISGMKMGITYALPIAPHHTLRFNAVNAFRFEEGADLWSAAIFYQYMWIRNKEKKNTK
jgi:hypothetical protein